MQRIKKGARLDDILKAFRRGDGPKRGPEMPLELDGVPVSPRTPPTLSGGAAAVMSFEE